MVDQKIIAMLSKLRPEDPLSSIDIADILWLATQHWRKSPLTTSPGTLPEARAKESSPPEINPKTTEPEEKEDKEETSDQSVSDQDVSVVTAPPSSPASPSISPTSPTKGLPFTVPAARALPQARLIARALRPLRQKVNSRTQRIIDIPATIDRVSEERILIPVLKPALERCFDGVLVVEKTSAYGIWQPIINEFEQLLLHQGGLRDVRLWYAEPQSDGTLQLQSRQGQARAVKELIQIGSQRLIFILSDCIDPAWSNGAWQKWCQTWGKHHTVTVIQMLPTPFWRRTQLNQLTKVWQRSETVNPLNHQWRFTDYTGLDEEFKTPQGFPVTVLPLEPYPLSVWGQGMLGRSPTDLTGYFLNAVPIPPTTSDTTITALERLDNFCRLASAPAQRLAALMSAVPIQLPIVRLIQQTILKQEASATQIAEIFLSGIVQRRGEASDPDKQLYEFYADEQADIRALLNQTLPEREIATVIDCLSADLAKRAGKSIGEFQAMLMAPTEAGVASELATEIGEFARVTLKVLKGLGGDYTAFAEALERGETEKPIDQPDAVELIPYDYEAVSLKVSNREDQTFAFVVGKLVKKQNKWEVEREERQAIGIVQWLTEEVKLELMTIPAGSFVMGAPKTEKDSRENERPQQLITLKSFHLGRFPVTQAQWRVVAGWEKVDRDIENAEPSRFNQDYVELSDDRWQRPVERISWYDAMEFCARLSRETGFIYRLAREAEWEYACRGIEREQLLKIARKPPKVGERSRTVQKWLTGQSTLSAREKKEVIGLWNQHCYQPFHFGPTLTDKVANYHATDTYNNGPKGKYREKTTPVGYLGLANAFGLYDLHGNVWEWCLDDYHDSLEGILSDGQPRQPTKQNSIFSKVLRGGSWYSSPWDCRSAYRVDYDPDDRVNFIGFRVVCEGPSL
jgi:formylglycine-generating enzyme required for sulfatase activity